MIFNLVELLKNRKSKEYLDSFNSFLSFNQGIKNIKCLFIALPSKTIEHTIKNGTEYFEKTIKDSINKKSGTVSKNNQFFIIGIRAGYNSEKDELLITLTYKERNLLGEDNVINS